MFHFYFIGGFLDSLLMTFDPLVKICEFEPLDFHLRIINLPSEGLGELIE